MRQDVKTWMKQEQKTRDKRAALIAQSSQRITSKYG